MPAVQAVLVAALQVARPKKAWGYGCVAVYGPLHCAVLWQVLNLDFCTLASLSPVLGQLTSLTTLDVEGNLYLGDSFRGATTPAAAPLLPNPQPFPVDIAGLQGLRFLNLNSCGLTSIPTVSAFTAHCTCRWVYSSLELRMQHDADRTCKALMPCPQSSFFAAA